MKKYFFGIILTLIVFLVKTPVVLATDGWWSCSFSTPQSVVTSQKYIVSYEPQNLIQNFGVNGTSPLFWARVIGTSWAEGNATFGSGFPYFGPKIKFFNGSSFQEGFNVDNNAINSNYQQTINSEMGFEWQPQTDFALSKIAFYSSEPGNFKLRLWDKTTEEPILPNNLLAECSGTSNLPPVTLPVVTAGNNISTLVNQTVNFSGSFTDPGTNETYTITWNFGDNTPTATTLETTHVYTSPGSFTATLTVVDNYSNSGSSSLTVEVKPVVQTSNVCVDFHPQVLNLKSKGSKVTVYSLIPKGAQISDIDKTSIKLNGVPALLVTPKPKYLQWLSDVFDDREDHDDGDEHDFSKRGCRLFNEPYIKSKFDRQLIKATLTAGKEVQVNLTGKLLDGSLFTGTDLIKVIK